MTSQTVKLYVVLNFKSELWAQYQAGQTEWVQKYITAGLPPEQRNFLERDLEVTGLPSNVDPEALKKRARERETPPGELVVALTASADAAEAIRDVFAFVRSDKKDPRFAGAGADLPISSAEHWCPGQAGGGVFADRKAAEALVGVDALKSADLYGENVNVVIIDQGLDAARLGDSYAGGWEAGDAQPGEPQRGPDNLYGGHGMMIARNILSIAPRARLFDVPMLPPRIGKIREFFLSTANAAYERMLDGIAAYKNEGRFPGSWVLVNAWSVFDRRTENPFGDYTNNPLHAFHAMVARAEANQMDVVFAAGNCGQFCPSAKCGPNDRGPGDSILGANSYRNVLTVGAVRADTMWLGYSSQGPGQLSLEPAKPDLCAPSQFREDSDAYMTNTGTSAAAALTAGVIAALRSNSRWDQTQVTPQQLRDILKRSARPADDDRKRIGHGILNAAGALAELRVVTKVI
jgi:subtilisin family serine protease